MSDVSWAFVVRWLIDAKSKMRVTRSRTHAVVVVVVSEVVSSKLFQVHFNMTNTESCDSEFEMNLE
jgi:hypothetical protein